MTYDQSKTAFENTTGQVLPTTHWFVARILDWMSKELAHMFRWCRNVSPFLDKVLMFLLSDESTQS